MSVNPECYLTSCAVSKRICLRLRSRNLVENRPMKTDLKNRIGKKKICIESVCRGDPGRLESCRSGGEDVWPWSRLKDLSCFTLGNRSAVKQYVSCELDEAPWSWMNAVHPEPR